jgi:hypothetical protein
LISRGEIVALGAPFFSGLGCAVAEGVAIGSGVLIGVGVAVSSGAVVVDGDALGVGDFFLRFDFVSGEELADGVGEIFFFGEAVGDGLGVDFPVERFRCFRDDVGVGVGSKIFSIFVPNDSSAASGAPIVPTKSATIRKSRSIALTAGDKGQPASS